MEGLQALARHLTVGGPAPIEPQRGEEPNMRREIPLKALWVDERGATAVEYAILVSMIAGAIVLTVASIGLKVQDLYARVVPGW